MNYEVIVGRVVSKQIKRLDRQAQTRVLAAIRKLANNPRPQGYKKLVDADGLYRIHVDRYRIVYKVEDEILTVTTVKVAKRDEKTY